MDAHTGAGYSEAGLGALRLSMITSRRLWDLRTELALGGFGRRSVQIASLLAEDTCELHSRVWSPFSP